MSTPEESCRVSTILHAFKTDNTVLLEALTHTIMVLHGYSEATSTGITVEEILATPNPAYATLITVIVLLFWPFVIIQRADLAEILGKVFVTFYASFAFWLLSCASKTFDHGNFVTIESMIFLRIHLVLIMDLIMT